MNSARFFLCAGVFAGCFGEQLPERKNVKVENSCEKNWNLSAKFLYWQAVEDNLEPATAVDSVPLNLSVFYGYSVNTQIRNMNFDYTPGFKLGLEWFSAHKNHWDFSAEYTRFYSTNRASSSIDFPGYFYPLQLPSTFAFAMFVENIPQVSVIAKSFEEKWKLETNWVDLLVGYNIDTATPMSFHPFVGVKGLFLNQKLEVSYDISSVTSPSAVRMIGSGFGNTKSWGVGPDLGIDIKYQFGRDFRIFSRGAGNFLYTHYQGKLNANVTYLAGQLPSNQKEKQNIDTFRTVLETEVGFGWMHQWKRCEIDLALSYAFNMFWDQQMFRAAGSIPTDGATLVSLPRGNLYLQGLNLSFGLFF